MWGFYGCWQIEAMASQAAAQARFAEQTERGLLERLRAAEFAGQRIYTVREMRALAHTELGMAAGRLRPWLLRPLPKHASLNKQSRAY